MSNISLVKVSGVCAILSAVIFVAFVVASEADVDSLEALAAFLKTKRSG